MRNVKRLCGPDALDARIAYVLQDLFIIPHHLGGKVMLLDDIYNLGASCRVYSRALKDIASAQSVCAVNLAATRFRQGKDGCAVRFVAEKKVKPCGVCFADANNARKWWRFGL